MTQSLKQTTTLKRARQEVGRALNQTNRSEQVRMLNRIRQWIYSNQRDYGLDLSVTFCQPLSCMCEECPQCSCEKRLGFRLPHHYRNLAAAESNGSHALIHSSFQMPYDNVSGYRGELGVVRLFENGSSPLRKDFPNCCPSKIGFQSSGSAVDTQPMAITGKLVGEEGEQTFEYSVSRSRNLTGEVFESVSRVGFCDGVDGSVVLTSEGGEELARYQCGEVSPQYQEYRVLAACAASTLVVRANCEYRDLYDDCDVVEFGDLVVWSSLAKYLLLLEKTDMTANDRANLSTYLSIATKLMQSNNSIGSESLDFNFRRKPLKGGRLKHSRYGARR